MFAVEGLKADWRLIAATFRPRLRHALAAPLTAALLAASFTAAQPAAAQTFPDHALRLVVAYAPGGSTDIVGRMIAQEMSADLGQTVVLENRAGGGTLVGTESVKRSQADGYTLLFGTNAFVITPMLHDRPTYDPLKDFQPIGLTTLQSLGVLVTPGLKVTTIAELVAYAKANPGKLNFASSGNGSAQHLAGEAFASTAGISMTHVPYKGAGPAMTDLLAGRVDVMFTSLVGNMEHINEGRLKLVATTGSKRSPATPQVPTVAESGYRDFVTQSWQGVLAPANTPRPVVDRLNASLVKVGKSQRIMDALAAQNMELRISSPEELSTMLSKEQALYRSLLQKTKTSIQ